MGEHSLPFDISKEFATNACIHVLKNNILKIQCAIHVYTCSIIECIHVDINGDFHGTLWSYVVLSEPSTH